MSNRYRKTTEPIERKNCAQMERTVNFDLASSGEIIRALEARGYRTFPVARIIERPDGWFIEKIEPQNKKRIPYAEHQNVNSK